MTDLQQTSTWILLTVIPYYYTCSDCHQKIAEKEAFGFRAAKNVYIHAVKCPEKK